MRERGKEVCRIWNDLGEGKEYDQNIFYEILKCNFKKQNKNKNKPSPQNQVTPVFQKQSRS